MLNDDDRYEESFDEDDIEENPTCPVDGGPGMPLGALGYFTHFRCQCCGWEFTLGVCRNCGQVFDDNGNCACGKEKR